MNQTFPVTLENPVAVLTDPKTYSEFYQRIKAEVGNHIPDLTTERGRKEIASLAYKVTRSKTAIDEAGKKLNEEARAKINAVDAQRRKIRDELDALAEDVRRPLTDWENAEKAREQEATKVRSRLQELAVLPHGASAQYISDTIGDLRDLVIDPAIFLGNTEDIENAKQAALRSLEATHASALKAEQDAADLARLRAEQEAREQAEREAKERAEHERAERERREKAEAEYKANVERAAEEARQAEIAKAKAEQARIEREAAAKVAAAEAEARAIKDKAEREERDRQEQLERTKREEDARQKDREHRGKVMGEAKQALIDVGAAEDLAKKIVLAIVASEIPHVSLRF